MKINIIMRKNEIKRNITQIKKMTHKMPKSLNEALNFENDDMDFDMDMEMDDQEDFNPRLNKNIPNPKMQNASNVTNVEEEDSSNIENFISNMRKESLNIMKSLADDPDNSVYQFAKKIFQLADKAHEDKKEGKDINGQPRNTNQPEM